VREGRQHALAQCGVLGNLPEFLGREGTRLVEDSLTGPDFPDVVQLATQPDPIQAMTIEAQP
jgi:hypothetical protein